MATAAAFAVAMTGCARVAPRPTVIPWLPLPARNQVFQAPESAPSPPPAVPPGTLRCGAGQLEGIAIQGGVGAGNQAWRVILRNRGGAPCSLEGYADLWVQAAGGQVLAGAVGTAGEGTYFDPVIPAVPILMAPGTPALETSPAIGYRGVLGQAYMHFQWVDCRHPLAATVSLALPGGELLSVPFEREASTSPACDSPGAGGYSSLSRGFLFPSEWNWSPQPEYIDLGITIFAPEAVQRGSTLVYQVTLLNRGEHDYPLDRCPDYGEYLGLKSDVGADYQLNCAPARTIPAGGSVVFEMRLEIPATVPPGRTDLSWELRDFRIAAPRLVTAPIAIA
jgi:hypothetical protein